MLRRLRRSRKPKEPTLRPVDAAGRYGLESPELDARVEQLVASVDAAAFAALAERHADLAPFPGPGKYLDIHTWMRRHLIHADALGLVDSPPQRILDVGTGAGYFPYLCKQLGHDAHAIDLDEMQAYNELVQLLGVDRRVHRVEVGEPLPDFGMRFDWVTAFNVMFNRNNHPQMWKPAEWEIFLDHLATAQLAPGGQVFLKLNPIRLDGYDRKGLLAFFESRGAEVSFPFVHFPDRERLTAG